MADIGTKSMAGKTILVTGGTGGIGKATAVGCARRVLALAECLAISDAARRGGKVVQFRACGRGVGVLQVVEDR